MSTRNSFDRFFQDAVRIAADREIQRRNDAEQSYRAEQHRIDQEWQRQYDIEHCLGDYSEREEC